MTLHHTFDPQVQVIADSISPQGIRLTTLQFRQPRMVHADFMTHRAFSRNARSSRAVPTARLLAEDPYIPHFMKNQPGMMASAELSRQEAELAEEIWLNMARHVRHGVQRLNELGVHKQWANRPLEWFGYIDVLVTSTDWTNYLALRTDEAAQPEIQQVAVAIQRELIVNRPGLLHRGEWHLPYIRSEDWNSIHLETYTREMLVEVLKKISAARCARLSIKPFDGNDTIEAELARYDKLVGSMPKHMSPLEHQATPDTWATHAWDPAGWANSKLHGNFTGWIQYRKTIPGENVKDRLPWQP